MLYRIEVTDDYFMDDPIDTGEISTTGFVTWLNRTKIGDQPEIGRDQWYAENKGDYKHILSLYMYSHGGISLSTEPFSCSFDSGWAGFVYSDSENVEDILQDVKTYENYLNNTDCYGYTITNNFFNEVEESCCGFSSYEEAMGEAESVVENLIKQPVSLPFTKSFETSSGLSEQIDVSLCREFYYSTLQYLKTNTATITNVEDDKYSYAEPRFLDDPSESFPLNYSLARIIFDPHWIELEFLDHDDEVLAVYQYKLQEK